MKVGDTLRFEGPRGSFTLREPAPHPLHRRGHGLCAHQEHCGRRLARGVQRPMRLYWGTRKPQDLYMLERCEQWQREHANFTVVPVVSDASEGDGWTGRTGLVHEAMLADFADLSGHEVYLCGSVKMVETAVPAFIAQGWTKTPASPTPS
jgi:NAD(P)H-flavin reductase